MAIESDRGHIAWVQEVLRRYGYAPGPVDGVIGPRTRGAVRWFQVAYAGAHPDVARLAIDGVPGPQTSRALDALPHLSPHFTTHEMGCKHCGRVHVDGRLLEALEVTRRRQGDRPIVIISGYRCAVHNHRVGGAEHSQHLVGRAADLGGHVDLDDVLASHLYGGVGRRGDRASHVDVRQYDGVPKTRGPIPVGDPAQWSYG